MSAGWSFRVLLDGIAARGERPALATVIGGQVAFVSHATLAGRVRGLAAGLVRLGVAPGEPVALFAPNGPDWVVARLALGLAGAVAVAIDDLAPDEELAAILADSGARRLFTTEAHLPAIRALADPSLDAYLMAERSEGGVRSWQGLFSGPAAALPTVGGAAPAMLVYTSGTTGAPKPFHLTYDNIAANLAALTAERLIGAEDRVLLPLPLHHAYPLIVGLLTPLASGACVVFPEAVAGPQLLQALKAAAVTAMVGVPRLYLALLSGLEARVAARGRLAAGLFALMQRLARRLRPLLGRRGCRLLFARLHAEIGPALRLLVSGGARLEPAAVARLEALGWEVLSGYGLAETASIFTGNLPGRRRLGSEGRPLGRGEIRIAEPDEAGIGEIQLKGPNVFAGYRDPALAAETFTPDGWFRTGDLGRLDAEGYLYVVGRAREQIVLGGGKKVHPEELEQAYGASPYIRELALLEKEGGLVALVLPDLVAMRASGYTRPEDVIRVHLAAVAQSLPSYQRLAGFALVREPLPRTRLGKYQRFRLPALYEAARAGRHAAAPAALSAADEALLAASPAREVWALLRARYAGKPLSLEASPALDLGIDSLEWIALGLELEARGGIRLAEAQIARIGTVRDLLVEAGAAARVEAAQGEGTTAALTAEERRWIEPPGPLLALFGVTVYWLNRALMRLFFRLRVEGRPNLPDGPYVLAPNHASDLDVLAVGAALPLAHMRRIWWAGDAARLFATPLRRALCRVLHVFPVDEHASRRTVALARAVLARGDRLIWFPESWRSPTGELQRFLPGIGLILAGSRLPVLPAAILGAYEAMPRDRRLPRRRPVTVRIGRPIPADRLAAAGEGVAAPARLAEALRVEVAALLRQRSAP